MEETTDMKALGPMEIDKSRNDPNKKERGDFPIQSQTDALKQASLPILSN